MQTDEIYTSLNELFNDVFLREDIALAPSTTAKDVEGWDSFKMIEIIMAVQEKFGIKVSTKELDGLKNVGDLVAVISKRKS
jgi:acyl carrier protein